MYKYQSSLLNNYRNAKYNSVNEAYKNPSIAKQRIEKHILTDMLMLNGFNYKVCSKSSHFFTAAFLYPDKENGQIKIMYYTPSSQYTFDI